MKIVVAPDKFRGCLAAGEVAEAIAQGIRRFDPSIEIDMAPVADGGEGTAAVLVAATGGRTHTVRVTGPLADMQVDAVIGILGDGKTAVVELAAASGLALVPPGLANPMRATTYGTGQLILAAAKMGMKEIIVGLGGAATVDGGIGCAQACGLPVLLDDGQADPHEPLVGGDLPRVMFIKHGRGGAAAPLDHVRIRAACDVTNPLFGESGAAKVYGPQKGATPEQVELLDTAMRRLAERTQTLDAANLPGAGSSGGMGYALAAFFGATLHRGIELVTETMRLPQRLSDADLCITAEGRLDAQTAHGKAVCGVANRCQAASVPCIALAGAIGAGAEAMYEKGLTAYSSICDRPMELAEAMRDAARLLASAAENMVRLRLAGR